MTRRSFLKASLRGALLSLGRPAFLEALIAGRLPEGRLLLYNIHTGERLDVTYRSPSGHYDPKALEALNYFLRCHYTQKVAKMDIQVIEFLNAVDKGLGGGHEIHIISGFRSPEYNERLIRQGRGVAKWSLHLLGKAIDFRIPGIGLRVVRQAALGLGLGGVGYYPRSGFLHLDSGRFRFW